MLPGGSSDAAEKAKTLQVKIHSTLAPLNGAFLDATGNVSLVREPATLSLLVTSSSSGGPECQYKSMKRVPRLKRDGSCLGSWFSTSLMLPSCCE